MCMSFALEHEQGPLNLRSRGVLKISNLRLSAAAALRPESNP
jgi:hypothetical protein